MIILRHQLTLDDAIKSVVRTYPNGCNYRLRKYADGLFYLEEGCHFVMVGGDDRLLHDWFSNPDPKEKLLNILQHRNGKRLSGFVHQDTIDFLLKAEPCLVCGGARFAVQE